MTDNEFKTKFKDELLEIRTGVLKLKENDNYLKETSWLQVGINNAIIELTNDI